jgi:hypothetical protein
MRSAAEVVVHAPRDVVWKNVTDIATSAGRVKGVEKVEVLEKPEKGLKGLKWRETRTLMGKEAVATMWVSDAVYLTRMDTESHEQNMVYTTRTTLQELDGGGIRLRREFGGVPQTFGAKVMGAVFSVLMRGTLRKALQADLEDIKAASEAGAASR